MTILAGMFSRHPSHPLDLAACDALRASVSRYPGDEPITFRDSRVCLVKVDIGAFEKSAVRVDPDGSVSMLAGEAILAEEDDDSPPTRDRELDAIHDALLVGDLNSLRRAQGCFCAVHYQPSGRLFMVTDKLGLRPIYYYQDDTRVIFASALRILEALDQVPKMIDLRGVTELTVFGYPLADRTPYVNVTMLRAAEVVEVTGPALHRTRYWRWDRVPRSTRLEPELAAEAYARFLRAVRRRLRSDAAVFAFLSGGLDSRCVVAILRDLGTEVYTVNLAPPEAQDRVFAEEFARAVGTIHEQYRFESGSPPPDWLRAGADLWGAEKHRRGWPVERPHLSWTGEGGSVGVGHVHMHDEIVELLRAGNRDAAIEEFLRRETASLIKRFLRHDFLEASADLPRQGLREELDAIEADDPARGFHLFLMLNDQRRNRARHFENIDLYRSEYHMPFFDGEFLESILQVPVERCLGHRFYAAWLEHFPPFVRSVPWQSYPDHLPCPLPVPSALAYQWDRSYLSEAREVKRRNLIDQARRMLDAPDFPSTILSAPRLRLASWLYRAGLRDYDYVFAAAGIYYAYWKAAGGRYVLPAKTWGMTR